MYEFLQAMGVRKAPVYGIWLYDQFIRQARELSTYITLHNLMVLF